MTKMLSATLHDTVKLKTFHNVEEVKKALAKGQIDMAFIKAVPYADLKNKNANISGLVAITTIGDKVATTHTGYIVTLASNNINLLRDLKDKRFGFVKNSASGSIYTVAHLEEQGINYKNYFSAYQCYNNEHQLLKAIKANEIDAGTTFRSPLMKHNKDIAEFKIISKFSEIPNPLIAASPKLSPSEKQQLSTALKQLPATAFKQLRFSGVADVDEELYKPVAELNNHNGNICKS